MCRFDSQCPVGKVKGLVKRTAKGCWKKRRVLEAVDEDVLFELVADWAPTSGARRREDLSSPEPG
jgi:hypothetical protein